MNPASSPARKRLCLPQGTRRLSILLLALGLVSSAWAQRDSLPRMLLSPDLLPEPKLSAQERETIRRGLDDLQSDNPELRAGAVMLLGKYQARAAKNAVVDALDDPSARVRRAALVSVAEWRHGLSVKAVEPVLNRIADEDVEVRRAVAAMIPQMMNIWRTARMVQPSFANRNLKTATQQALTDAFQDDDAVVRRNMLINFHNLSLPVAPEVFVTLMEDSDRGVRLEAIPLAIGYAQPEQWRGAAQAIVEGDDQVARLRLTSDLGRRGSPESFELLETLAGDSNPEVAAEARLSIFRWTGDPNQLNWLTNQLQSERLTQDQGQRFLQTLRGYRELAAPIAVELTQLDSSVLRQEAVRLYLGLNLPNQDPAILERLLQDSNREIRAMAVESLFDEPESVTGQQEMTLLDNPYPDVRAALVQLAARQGRQQGAGLLFDLMLDESIDVRVAAMETMSAMRVDGWMNVVSASLEDPDFALQRSALAIMMRERNFPDRVELLRKFVRENPQSPLAPLIRTEIGDVKMIEIDMNNL